MLPMKQGKYGGSQSIDHNCPPTLFKEPSSAYSLTTPWIKVGYYKLQFYQKHEG